MNTLRKLWKPDHLESADVKCCHCGDPITKDDTLATTFALQGKDYTAAAEGRQHEVPWMSETIVLFDRHLRCLLSAETEYVTVSHVWDPAVSELQNEYAQALAPDKYSDDEIASVARRVLQAPVRIYAGIVASLNPETKQEGRLEVWHDYVSVPQWSHQRKGRIIQEIPKLYSHASFVVPFFHDVAPSSVQAMRKSSSTKERVQGIFDVCNSRWYRRMWTAMEYVQSSQLRPMLQDYKLLDECRSGLPFADEPVTHWKEEMRKTTWHDVMRFDNGTNVHPHSLGPLEPTRNLRLQGKINPFSECFNLVSRRQVTVPADFLHALLGLTGPIVEFSELPHSDLRKSVSIIAKARLRLKGDLSPLFMMPRNRDVDEPQASGFIEFGVFGLGTEEFGPEFTGIILSGPEESKAKLKAQRMGTVTMAKRFWKKMDARTFNRLVREVLDITGPDPDAFAETIWCRFFGESLGKVQEVLGKESRRSLLQMHLELLYNESPGEESWDNMDYVAQLFMLNKWMDGGNFPEPALSFGKSLDSFSSYV